MGRLVTIAIALLSVVCELGSAGATPLDVSPGGFAIALSQVRPGDVLRLTPGVYRGPFKISAPSVQLSGDPRAIIDGGGQGTALTLAADGIKLEGITVRGSGNDLTNNDAVILVLDAHRVTVRRCHVEAKAFGIYLRGGGEHVIAENQIRGDASLKRSQRGNGIHLWHTEGNRVLDNTVTEVRDGLYLSFAHHNLIQGNDVSGVRYGIHYMYSDDNTLMHNRLEKCLGGATLMFAKRNLIRDNDAIGNRRFGILLLSIDSSRFINNLVARNDRGFVIGNSNSDRFDDNRIRENGIGAFITAGSEGNVFASNEFDGNLVQAYVDHAGINRWTENGRGNFWSDYIGFDLNGNGIGETPYRLQNATSALIATRPQARWLMMSPTLALLDWFQQRVVETDNTYLDPAPLVVRLGR